MKKLASALLLGLLSVPVAMANSQVSMVKDIYKNIQNNQDNVNFDEWAFLEKFADTELKLLIQKARQVDTKNSQRDDEPCLYGSPFYAGNGGLFDVNLSKVTGSDGFISAFPNQEKVTFFLNCADKKNCKIDDIKIESNDVYSPHLKTKLTQCAVVLSGLEEKKEIIKIVKRADIQKESFPKENQFSGLIWFMTNRGLYPFSSDLIDKHEYWAISDAKVGSCFKIHHHRLGSIIEATKCPKNLK